MTWGWRPISSASSTPGKSPLTPCAGRSSKMPWSMETLKHRFNRGRRSNLSFFRDKRGLECDLLYETGDGIGAIEVKAGATIASDYFRELKRVVKVLPRISGKAVVYGGADRQFRRDAEVAPLADLPKVLERFDGREGT